MKTKTQMQKTTTWAIALIFSSFGLLFCGVAFVLVSLAAVAWGIWQLSQLLALSWQLRLALALIVYVGLVGGCFMHSIYRTFAGDDDDALPGGLEVVLLLSDVCAVLASTIVGYFLFTRPDGPVVEVTVGLAILALLLSPLCCFARRQYDYASRLLEPCDPPTAADHYSLLGRAPSPDDVIYVDSPEPKNQIPAHRSPRPQYVPHPPVNTVPRPTPTVTVISSGDWQPF